MNVDVGDGDLVGRLRRLDAGAASPTPGFDYQGMLERHAFRQARARRRAVIARGTVGALLVAMIGLSVWRMERSEPSAAPAVAEVRPADSAPARAPEQRLVRADTYLALAALEDHIASIDDALSDARVIAPGGAEVARLERTRAELLDSYVRVRYADMVAANF
jgi:hypothetical protein